MNKPLAIVPCVGIICFRERDVLLIRRGKPPFQGGWSIPGGRIEFGETAEAAALRELKEETGISAHLCGLVDVVDGLFPDDSAKHIKHHYLLCDYAARWVCGAPRAADDAAHVAFVSPKELATLPMWEETRQIIEKARRLNPKDA